MKTTVLLAVLPLCAALADREDALLDDILRGGGAAATPAVSAPAATPAVLAPTVFVSAVPAKPRLAPPAAEPKPPAGGFRIEKPDTGHAATWPFSMALVPPVQFPSADDDVVGIRLGLPWARHHDVYGLDVDALAGEAAGDAGPLSVAGVYSGVGGDMTGIQIAGLVNRVEGRASGVQASAIANVDGESSAIQVALVNATARDAAGLQIGVWNDAGSMSGLQIGVFNFARSLYGVQIGLSNYVEDSPLPWFPIMNVCF